MDIMQAITGFMGVVLAYCFTTIVNIPKNYVLKKDFERHQDRLEEKLDKLQSSIEYIKERLNK
jgi:prefoldin subunit 5